MTNLFAQSRLRPSSYNILVESEDGERFGIAQGIQGYMDVVDPTTGRWLRDGMVGAGPKPEVLRDLEQRGYLTLLSADQEREMVAETIRYKAAVNSAGSAGFTIILNYDCNFRCPYCIQRDIQNRGESFQQGMTDEVMDSAFRFMESSGKHFNLTLYGGEPFTVDNRHQVVRFLAWVKRQNKKISCISNGYGWDHFWDVLEPDVISSIQVTVDGPPKYHNRRRIIRGEKGTFTKIMDNIVEALQRGLSIAMRVNTDRHNVGSMADLEEVLGEYDLLNHPRFSYQIANVTSNKIMSESTMFGKQEMYEAAQETGCNSCASGPYQGATKLLPAGLLHKVQTALDSGRKSRRTITGCSAYTNLYVIDPFGKLYACWDAVGLDQEVIGAYHPQVEFREAGLARWRNRHEKTLIEKCLECPYVFHHASGCQAQAEKNTGDWNERNCDDYPWMFDSALKDRIDVWAGGTTITSRLPNGGAGIARTA